MQWHYYHLFLLKKSENLLIKALENKADHILSNFSIVSGKSIQENSFSNLQALINEVAATDPQLVHIVILNSKGVVIATSNQKKYQQFSKVKDELIINHLKNNENIRFHIRSNNQLISICNIYSKNSQTLEDDESDNLDVFQEELLGFLYLSLNMKCLKDSISKLWLYSGCLALIINAIGMILTYWFGSKIVRPIAIIVNEIRIIASGNLDKAIHSKSNDELGQLVSDVDKMRLAIKAQNIEIFKQNNELKKLDRLKDEFLANTSHELRTPLNGIIGISESLIEGSTGKLNNDTIENLDIISSSARRLSSLVNEILDFSKLRQNKMDLHYKTLNLRKIVQNIYDLSVHSLKAKPIKLINNVDESLPGIYADENRLIQIFHNIVGNAIKFTNKGSIRTEAKLFEDAYIQIQVIDTGIGIADNAQQDIFKSFVQADGSAAREFGGTGLGLSITKMLVELHGGKIGLESEPEKGTKIIFTMPISENNISSDKNDSSIENYKEDQITNNNLINKDVIISKDTESFSALTKKALQLKITKKTNDVELSLEDVIADLEQNHKSLNVLAVDDETVNLQVVKNYLKNKKFNLQTASSGFEALEMIKQNKSSEQSFHLVLLDVMMPKMTGYQVAIEIRKDFNLFEMPIIMVTAKNQPGDLVKGFMSGANDYITKPFLGSELITRMNIHGNLQDAYEKLQKTIIHHTNELQKTNKELEIAKEDALAAANAKSVFLANMSHEIRTPMNGVIVAAELALDKNIPFEVRHYLDIIHSSGKTLLGIINDILDFSKIEAGKLDLEKGQFILDQIIERITEMFIPKIMEKNIELLVDIDVDVPGMLIGDSLRLHQIITNLVGNALKFTPENGEIFIGVECIKQTSQEATIKFCVKDTGIGISKEYLKNLFTPFTQADSSTSRKFGGTGLGLTICKQLVEMMNGDIWAESEINKGTQFYFTILIEKQTKQETVDLNIPDKANIKHALIVDDNYESRKIIIKILKTLGMETSNAASGVKAIEQLKYDKSLLNVLDLIIIDLRMPELDGIETSKQIRMNLQLDIPIILLTAFGDEKIKKSARKTGINGFIAKPSNPVNFFNEIMDVFGKKEFMIIKHDKKNKSTKASLNKKALKGSQILVAEDNPTNQDIVKAVLKKADIIVTIANNGKEAIEAIHKNNYDAVLMDIQMPEMDGYTAAKEIRKNKKFDNLPVIAMTAHALKTDEEKCMKAGMNSYVSKPINQNILFEILSKYISPKYVDNVEENVLDNEIDSDFDKDDFDNTIDHDVEKNDFVNSIDYDVEKNDLDHVIDHDLDNEDENIINLPGIDVNHVMTSLGIDWDVYSKILIRFRAKNIDIMNKIKQAYNSNDWEELSIIAHTLKGSGGNIGASQVSYYSSEIDKMCKEKNLESVNEIIMKLEVEINKVFKSINQIPNNQNKDIVEEKNYEKIGNKKIEKILSKFEKSLIQSQPEEIFNNFSIAKKYLESRKAIKIQEYIENYDYDEALLILKQINRVLSASMH